MVTLSITKNIKNQAKFHKQQSKLLKNVFLKPPQMRTMGLQTRNLLNVEFKIIKKCQMRK